MPGALSWRLLLLVLLLPACSAQQAMLPHAAELKLLPPAEGNLSLLLKQKLTMMVAGRQQQFLAVARFNQQNLKMVVLLATGQRLLTLDYDGVELQQQSDVSVDLPGTEILAILQFAHWPEASLRRHYRDSEGWEIEIMPESRRLLTHSGIALSIAYRPGELLIDNRLREYRVIVQTLEKTEL